MQSIILYANRNTGMLALAYLVAKGFKVKVITEDDLIVENAKYYGAEVVDFDTMGEFDLFICCHGRRIINKKYLIKGKFINIHPCLYKYKGHNPIRKYIDNLDTIGSVESQWLEEEVDGGKVLIREEFMTPVCDDYADFYNVAYPYYLKCLEKTLWSLRLL